MTRTERVVLGAVLALFAMAVASKESMASQYASGAHRIAFAPGGYAVSDGTYDLRVEFSGASLVTPLSEVPAGNRGDVSDLSPFGRTTYAGLWPGIDVTYDAPSDGLLRSTWSLEPGADPAAIRMRYDRSVRVTAAGGLVVQFETGAIAETPPVAWQEVNGRREPVEVAFAQLAANEVGFRVGTHRADLPLTIDPTVEWRTFLGGMDPDNLAGVAVDDGGNVYVTGSSWNSWQGAMGSPVDPYNDRWDVFVAKIDRDGDLVWHTFLGGAHDDYGLSIAVDCSGTVYVSGWSESSGEWENQGSCIAVENATVDHRGFVARLSNDGELESANVGGGSCPYSFFGSKVTGVAADCSGNVYAGGMSNSRAFAVKLTSLGVAPGTLKLIDGSEGEGSGTWLGGDGRFYLTGKTRLLGIEKPFAAMFPPIGDAVVAYLPQVGTTKAIAADHGGNVYVAGDNDISAFVMKLHPEDGDLALTWSSPRFVRRLDMKNFVRGIAASGSGDDAKVYLVGYSEKNDNAGDSPIDLDLWEKADVKFTDGALLHEHDAWVMQLSPATGDLTWGTFLNSTDESEWAFGVALDGSGIYVAGYGAGKWDHLVWGPTKVEYVENAHDDVFVLKLDAGGGAGDTCDPGANSDATCHAKRVEAWGAYVACMSIATAMFYQDLDHSQAAENHSNDCRQTYFLAWGPPCTGPRFSSDDVDGTVTDCLTGLVWEKKAAYDHNDQSPDLHDADKTYAWSDGMPCYESGTAFDEFLKTLNDTGFGGSNGWRLPTHAELLTLMVAWPPGDAPEAGHGMVPEFPDAANNSDWAYWSSTTAPLIHGGCENVGQCALNVMFDPPSGMKPQTPTAMMLDTKSGSRHVRAVRGGL